MKMSRGGVFLLDGNPKEYEIAEHIATKVHIIHEFFNIEKHRIHLKHETRGKI